MNQYLQSVFPIFSLVMKILSNSSSKIGPKILFWTDNQDYYEEQISKVIATFELLGPHFERVKKYIFQMKLQMAAILSLNKTFRLG